MIELVMFAGALGFGWFVGRYRKPTIADRAIGWIEGMFKSESVE